jgi:hypothetical protein
MNLSHGVSRLLSHGHETSLTVLRLMSPSGTHETRETSSGTVQTVSVSRAP